MTHQPIAVLLLLVSSFMAHGQNPDDPYQRFSKGYEKLDAAMVSQAYTEDALLINLYQGTDPQSFRGRDAITQFFTELFTLASEQGRQLKITFKVTNRQRVEETILDNGFYHLMVQSPQGNFDRYGKFSIALNKESGEWKFATDANSSASEEEYEVGNSNN